MKYQKIIMRAPVHFFWVVTTLGLQWAVGGAGRPLSAPKEPTDGAGTVSSLVLKRENSNSNIQSINKQTN